MSTLDDGEIVSRMRNGDTTGLEALLERHGPAVKGWLRLRYGMRQDDHALEDAIHDAAMNLWRGAKRLDATQNLAGYFYITARRELQRARKRANGHVPLWDGVDPPAAAPAETEQGAFAQALTSFLHTLPENEREILTMDAASGYTLSAAAIAAQIGLTPDSVYTLRSRAKQRLHEFLRQWPGRGQS